MSIEALDHVIRLDTDSPEHIMIIGDGMMDVYVHGEMTNVCQEGCNKFVEKSRMVVPGGASNAVRSLSNWNARVWSLTAPPWYSPTKTRYMVDDVCVFRYDNEVSSCCYPAIFDRRERLLSMLNEKSGDYPISAVLLSDYDKGMLSEGFIYSVVDICKKRNIPCVADAKVSPSTYRGCIVKGNLDYVMKFGMVDIITMGRLPPVVRGKNLVSSYLPVPCVNHVGAGDCFAAHLTLGLAYGLSLEEAAAVAHSAGRVYVQRRHNSPPCIQDIKADMLGSMSDRATIVD